MKLILQVLDIMLDGLLPDVESEKILYFLQKYNEWYVALTAPTFTEKSINTLAKLGDEVATLYVNSPLCELSPSQLKTRKFHMMFSHACDTIRYYGVLSNTNTSLWEGYHRVIKAAARRAAIQGTSWIAGTVALDQNVGTLYKNVNSSIKKKSLPSDEHLPPNKLIGAVLSTIVRTDFLNDDNNFTILRKKLNNNTKSFTGVFQLYQAYFQGKPEDEWPTK